jgi:hypothetical protein
MAGLFAIVAAYLSYREVACNDNHDAVKDWFKEKWILLNNSGWLSMPEKIIGLVLYLKNDAAETLSDFVSGRAQAKVIFILYFIALSSASIYHSGIFVAVIVILSCLPFMYFGYNYKLDELLELRPKYIGHFYGFLISIYSFYLWTVLFVETEIFLSAAISSLLLPVFWFSIFTPIAIAIHARNPDSNIDEDTLIIVGFSFAVSFCITLIAILIGKVSYPSAPLPQTIQMLLINTLFDGVTMLATIYILQWSIKDKPLVRIPIAICSDITIAAICAVAALYFGLLGSRNELQLEEVYRVLVGLSPYSNDFALTPFFWVMHTTFIPTLIYLFAIVVAWMAKLYYSITLSFIRSAAAHNSPLKLAASFCALVVALFAFLSFGTKSLHEFYDDETNTNKTQVSNKANAADAKSRAADKRR